MILLVTRRDDLTADFLIERLLARGVSYLRFDVDHYLDDVFLTAEFDGHGLKGEVTTPQGSSPLSAVRGVWYRRAMAPRLYRLDLHPDDLAFAEREARHFLEGALGGVPARWVNPWQAVHVWERKLAQLPLAAACGFRVPRTLIASDAARLSAFASQTPVVTKAIAQGFHETPAGVESVYTHAVPPARLANQAAAGLCPTLIQERLPKVADVRLTVVGSRLFAARLDADLPDGLDWRRPDTPVRYSPVEVPTQVAAAVDALHRRAGLRYGAFDFALMPDGDWVFLEVNPAGEFAWIEEELGFAIRDALIDELLTEDVP
jgi:glutathione synthase/RimK-type ligase-like ATP-grasp enzyme